MMDGLKSKLSYLILSSLPPNDPFIFSILTIAPECWTLRNIELNVSLRIAKKATDLKDEFGILAIPDQKKRKSLPE
ncbi:hypothetical protein TSAR_002379 [Trichomalopsis sarcophagae]|uniref:Uncharacterized protein n=1 Tax=Trichomalopsis sarcophagae TaxID=543379 RepID=A0A232FIX4_9HYME|nr:hypothetical protein TSAR_002379 [Trichomalopsis sarcophagae]